jgi:hypothetical protein
MKDKPDQLESFEVIPHNNGHVMRLFFTGSSYQNNKKPSTMRLITLTAAIRRRLPSGVAGKSSKPGKGAPISAQEIKKGRRVPFHQ